MSFPVSMDPPALLGVASSNSLVIYPTSTLNVFTVESVEDSTQLSLDARSLGTITRIAVVDGKPNQVIILGSEGLLAWSIESEVLAELETPNRLDGSFIDVVYDKGWVVAQVKDSELLSIRLAKTNDNKFATDTFAGKAYNPSGYLYYFNGDFKFHSTATGPVANTLCEEIFFTQNSVYIDDVLYSVGNIHSYCVLDDQSLIFIGVDNELVVLNYEGQGKRIELESTPLALSAVVSPEDGDYEVYFLDEYGVSQIFVVVDDIDELEPFDVEAEPKATPLGSGFVKYFRETLIETQPEAGSGTTSLEQATVAPEIEPIQDIVANPAPGPTVTSGIKSLAPVSSETLNTPSTNIDSVPKEVFDMVISSLRAEIEALKKRVTQLESSPSEPVAIPSSKAKKTDKPKPSQSPKVDDKTESRAETPRAESRPLSRAATPKVERPKSVEPSPKNDTKYRTREGKGKIVHVNDIPEAIARTLAGNNVYRYLETHRSGLHEYLFMASPEKAQLIRLSLIKAYPHTALSRYLVSEIGIPLVDATLYYQVMEQETSI